MSRPKRRDTLPARRDEHRTRRLYDLTQKVELAARFDGLRYGCSGKHKRNPHLYGVDPYHGRDSERSLCDEHAEFQQADFVRIPALLARSGMAALAGNLTWAVDDTGWIYELQVTNAGLNEWHGYPMLLADPFAQPVWERFSAWAANAGADQDRRAAQACAMRYRLRG